MVIFYLVASIFLFVYACYSWYWQAKITFKGLYSSAGIIGAVVLIALGFMWSYFQKGDQGLSVFLALLLLVGIINGFSGLTSKRVVVSNTFKRGIRYSNLSGILVVGASKAAKSRVICVFRTTQGRSYYLQIHQDIGTVVNILHEYIQDVKIEVEDIH